MTLFMPFVRSIELQSTVINECSYGIQADWDRGIHETVI